MFVLPNLAPPRKRPRDDAATIAEGEHAAAAPPTHASTTMHVDSSDAPAAAPPSFSALPTSSISHLPPFLSPEFAPTSPMAAHATATRRATKKSKLDDNGVQAVEDAEDGGKKNKKKKRRSGSKEKNRKGNPRLHAGVLEEEEMDFHLLGVERQRECVGRLVAQHVREQADKSVAVALSAVELDELTPDVDRFVALDESQHVLMALPNVVKKHAPEFKQAVASAAKKGRPCGSPVVLVVTSAALRAVELVRILRKLKTKTPVVKLFAKHIKLAQQADILKRHDVRVCVGTPNRVLKLIKAGALKLDQVTLAVVDMVRDSKQFNIFDVLATRNDMLALLHEHLIPQATTKLCFF